LEKRKLRDHKRLQKTLAGTEISFSKGVRLKPPLSEVVRSKNRTQTTKLIQVADRHYVCFLWRDGPVRMKSAFYGWLLHERSQGKLTAVASLHYHPSHKPAHLVTPCGKPEGVDYQSLGTSCHELMLDGAEYDPRDEHDRTKLIERFCSATGIEIVSGESYDAPASQSLDLRPLQS
jgi:hypothetical protein